MTFRTTLVNEIAAAILLMGLPTSSLSAGQQPAPTPQAPPQTTRPATPQPTPPAAQAPSDVVPLKVQIVVSRSKGDTPVSSLPFELMVNANARANTTLNMGVDVPVPAGPNSITYRRVGNNITCSSARYENGTVTLELSIEDSSVHADQSPAGPSGTSPAPPSSATPPPGGATYAAGSGPPWPLFRSFSTTTVVSMREGQSVQFTLATDKQTGETLKVSVTATRVR